MHSMDLLLIQPPYFDYDRERFSIFDPTSYMECHPPLGLAYLAAYCQNEHQIRILDMEAEKMGFAKFARYIRRHEPSIVGLTVSSPLFSMAIRLAKVIKEIKKIPVVVGGTHAHLDNNILNESNFDFVIRKEGEVALKQLLDYLLKTNGDIRDIKNLSFRENDKIFHNPDIPIRENLDQLPFPARELLPLNSYFSIGAKSNPCVSMITSRGCPFSCIFCNPMYRDIRRRSVTNVCDEIELIVARFGIRDIEFFDETFNLNNEWVLKFCNEILKRGLQVRWRARCRVGLFDKGLVKKMKQAGCNIISLGVESVNDRTLRFLKKGYSLQQIQDTVKLIKDENIELHGWFILGVPTESRAEMRNTINFAKKGKFDYALFSILTPMPKTELEEIAIKNRWISAQNRDYSKFLHQNKPILQHPQLSSKEILKLTRWAQITFFLKFSRLKELIKKICKEPKKYYSLIFRYFIKITIR